MWDPRFTLPLSADLLPLVLVLSHAPRTLRAESTECGLLDPSVAAFASLMLTFFTSALLYDYQAGNSRTKCAHRDARRFRTWLPYAPGPADQADPDQSVAQIDRAAGLRVGRALRP